MRSDTPTAGSGGAVPRRRRRPGRAARQLLRGDPISCLARRPDRRSLEAGLEQVPVPAHDGIDALLNCEGNEVVIPWVTRDRWSLGGILNDRGVTPDPFDEFTPRSLVGVPSELRPAQDTLKLVERKRAHDDPDALVDERADNGVGRASASADQRRDEDAWVDDDPDHAAPRSWRAA